MSDEKHSDLTDEIYLLQQENETLRKQLAGKIMPDEPEIIIANALWHDCDKWLTCKTNELEDAAERIINKLQEEGYRIIYAVDLKNDD